jgi:hypothetical protein
MSQRKKIENQLAEIDNLIATYQQQSRILQLMSLKLELKKEKLKDKIIIDELKRSRDRS